MRRWIPLVALAPLMLGLSGCGGATETLTETSDGMTASVVVSAGSQSDLDVINQGTPAADIKSGDQHTGTQICSATTTYKSNSYTVSIYLSGNVPAAEKTAFASLCSSPDFGDS